MAWRWAAAVALLVLHVLGLVVMILALPLWASCLGSGLMGGVVGLGIARVLLIHLPLFGRPPVCRCHRVNQ